ncbi:mCG144555, partial [Mus musculus]
SWLTKSKHSGNGCALSHMHPLNTVVPDDMLKWYRTQTRAGHRTQRTLVTFHSLASLTNEKNSWLPIYPPRNMVTSSHQIP